MVRNVHIFTLIVALIALALSPGCRKDIPAFVELDQARHTAADLRIQFGKAVDASNRAVMAETDEASIAFAREAEQTSRLVENDTLSLTSLLRSLHYPVEIRLLDDFKRHFSEYLALDRSILELAVENTNLKAQRLSFGASREAADGFRKSIESVAGTVPQKDRCRVELLVAKAVLAVREMQVLQAPHIAESDAATMTHIENELDRRQVSARDAVGDVSKLVALNARKPVVAALEQLERFKTISDQIVALSRRNSNVRSLDLALRTKPPLTAACDNSLRALQDALVNQGFKATR
jgi:hypothetical protein